MERRMPFSLSAVLLGAVAALGCSAGPRGAQNVPVELVVYAATSTRDALLGISAAYERDRGVDLTFNFGSSGDLSNQIVAAAQADVFLSAGEEEMDEVEAAGLVASGMRRELLSNQLVVIEPTGGPSAFVTPFDPGQLADADVELLSLADVRTVPAGRYAKAWLEQRGAWDAVAERVLPGVDARAALAAVESGGARAGIVYRTDVARSARARVVHEVPREEGPRIVYPVAVMTGRPREQEARAFVDFLGSARAGEIFEEFGFVFLAHGAR
jgi:molybdate transport system substrate-binding protein